MTISSNPLRQLQGRTIDQPITLVVFAPFGNDRVLSKYPDDQTDNVRDHPLVESARDVAACGVNVCLLIDRQDDDTWLVTIDAQGRETSVSQLKCNMASPRTLRGLLEIADRAFPKTTFVVSMEGHGAGYFPEIDASKLAVSSLTLLGNTKVEWVISPQSIVPRRSDNGAPLLPMGEPMLPMGEPMLPASHLPVSTWGIGHALASYVAARKDRASNIAVVHFNNCFNMSTELLHTVSPYADYAVGYPNYNFFTSGRAYAEAFVDFFASSARTSETLARAFALANRKALAQQAEPHPTVGCVIALPRMRAVAAAIDALALALIAVLPQERDGVVKAIERAQQYDTRGDFRLDVPDELTDVGSLAESLRKAAIDPQVTLAAEDLSRTLAGVFVYGERAKPWVDPNVEWPLDEPALSMNILLPDPMLKGLWDWRSPYYLETVPGCCIPQAHVIEFLQQTRWVPFLRKLHENVSFVGLKPPLVLEHPIARRYSGRTRK
jgi:hypothetical protein